MLLILHPFSRIVLPIVPKELSNLRSFILDELSLIGALWSYLHPLVSLRLHPCALKDPVSIHHYSLAVELAFLYFSEVQELLLLVNYPKVRTSHKIIKIKVLIGHLVILNEGGH